MSTLTAPDLTASGSHYDLVVYHGSPAGCAAALRAARGGLRVLLVNHTAHLGGLPASGLAVWDTFLTKRRSPIYDDLRQRLFDYYRQNYGSDSAAYLDCLPQRTGHTNGNFEPHVFEQTITALIEAEDNIDVLFDSVPMQVESHADGAIKSVAFGLKYTSAANCQVSCGRWIDASYEGDLLALAGAPYALGREAQSEFNEPHAGWRHMKGCKEAPGPDAQRHGAVAGHLAMRHWGPYQKVVDADDEKCGTGDDIPQAINFRLTLTRDPDNCIAVTKPADYDAEEAAALESFPPMARVPRQKGDFNRPQLVGEVVRDYVLGDWAQRQAICARFRQQVLGVLYWRQHQEQVPEAWQGWGLCRDEFVDNDHFPYEIYLREARRLHGHYFMTEHDLRLHEDYDRAPVHTDAVAVSDWYIDSHACHRTPPGAMDEGKMMLHKQTVPGQIPYRSLYCDAVPNLLVPVCLSASHVAQSGIRLEPTWMQIGEVCGLAAVHAKSEACSLAAIQVVELQARLLQERHLLAFANDCDVGSFEAWVPAVQWAATRGCFASYDWRPQDQLSTALAACWLDMAQADTWDDKAASALAARVAVAETQASEPVDAQAFATALGVSWSGPVTRAQACEWLWAYHRQAACSAV